MHRGITVSKCKIILLGKVRIIIHWCLLKKNVNDLKIKWRMSLTKEILTPLTKYSSPKCGTYWLYFEKQCAPGIGCFKSPQVFEEIFIILPPCADHSCLSLSLLMGVICFKHTEFSRILMRLCNPTCTVRVFLHEETTIY